MSVERRKKIIEYWNKASLCSRESSTSHADPDLAYVDNRIENIILGRCLRRWAGPRGRCLDIGAGLGRFAELLTDLYPKVMLLEPASSIYESLVEQWQLKEGIQCYDTDFESYQDKEPYDLVFASGVLYLYADDMLRQFVEKVSSMLAHDGLFVVRDFISLPEPHITKSTYVRGGFCYYRTPAFWEQVAKSLKFKFLGITRSKPGVAWLRAARTLRILESLRLKRLCRSTPVWYSLLRCGDFRVVPQGIQTVFVGMRNET